MDNIEVIVNEEKDSILKYDNRSYEIGNPVQVSITKSLDKGKRDLVLMYQGPHIPAEVKRELYRCAEDIGLKPEIMSRESVYLPNFRDVWSAEIPDDFKVNINYTAKKC